jgi:hypothetical protein
MHEWPRRLRSAVVAALGVEAALVVAAAVYLTQGLVTEEATEFAAAVLETVLAWLLAVGLAVLMVGVRRRRAWARGPVITIQLFALAVAWSMTTSEKWYLGVLLLAAALVGLTGIHPEVLGRAGRRGAEDDASASSASRPR